MQKNQSVSEMATEVLVRQAGARAQRTGQSLEEALKGVLQTQVAGLAQRGEGARPRAGGDALETPARKWRTMGRIEHTLLDEGRASSPTDLRPSPANLPYHKK